MLRLWNDVQVFAGEHAHGAAVRGRWESWTTIALGQAHGAALGDTPIVVGKNSERWGFIRSGNTLVF